MEKRGRKRRFNYAAVVAYAVAHPTTFQVDIARHFGTTQSRISTILSQHGVKPIIRGAPIKLKAGQSDEEFQWEKALHEAGLGMGRGLRLGKQRIFYGYDPFKESASHDSATLDSDK